MKLTQKEIADIFQQSHYQHLPKKLYRIRQEIATYPTMNLTVEEIPNGLHVSLSYTRQKTKTNIQNVSENVSEKLSPNQQKMINAIKGNRKITYAELSKLIGIAPTNVARNIKKLVESKKLKRVGSAKGGHWEVTD